MASCDLVVLAFARATHVPILDVLRDWSAAGMVSPLVVVDTDAVREDEIRLPAVVLEGGRTRPVLLQEEISTRSSTRIARVVAVTDVGGRVDGPSGSVAQRLADAVTSGLPTVELVRLHLVGLALQGASPPADLAWLGWHNVVVAPENAPSPTSGIAPIVYTPSDPVRVAHLVGALCSVAGLWSAEPTGPFDDRPMAPGAGMLAARTFTRHLSATAVESELLRRLADVHDGYPAPLTNGSSAARIDDQVGASVEMADRLLAKHPYVLPRERVMPAPTAPTPIGAMAALRMLFSFLATIIRDAPRVFVDRLVRGVSTAVAGSVSTLVFGRGESQYTVVVNGVTADGLPASWLEVDAALDNVGQRANGGQALVHSSNLDLSAFWKDFVGGGLTLLDAGARSDELAPRMVGGQRAVVTDGPVVASDPDDTFTPPEAVGAYVKTRRIPPYDGVGARILNTQLDQVAASTPHVAGPARAAQSELQGWATTRERSYVGRVGRRIGEGITTVRQQIEQYSEVLRSADDAAAIPSAIEEQQRRLASRLRLLLVVAVVLAVVVVLLTLGPLTWPVLVVALVVIVVGWLVSSLLVFIRGQRDLFALLHRRRELMDQLEVVRRHLLEAIEDLRRLSRTYRQYLDWAAALGRFVTAPLGTPAPTLDEELLLGDGLPRNHRFGAARPDPMALDEIAARVRRDIFIVGWASAAWETFVRDVPADLGQVAFRIREDTEVLFADPGVARDSMLTTWSEKVAARQGWEGATELLQGMLGSLSGPSKQQIGPALLAKVESRDPHGGTVTVDYAGFVNQLDDEAAVSGGYQSFARDMFGPQASSEPWLVASTVTKRPTSDFSRTIVVTQLSHGFQGYELRSSVPQAPAPSPAVGSSTAPIM